MKLKILPPTLRINNRYLTLDIKSESILDKNELVSAIWYSCLRLYGEIETSSFNLWVMRFYNINNINNFNNRNCNINNKDNNFNNINYNINNRNSNINNKNSNINDIDNSIDNKYSDIDNKDNNVNIMNNNKNNQINNDLSYYYYYKVVLRCQRGSEDKVRGSLALLAKYNHKKIAISTIGISGTIASSIENFIK